MATYRNPCLAHRVPSPKGPAVPVFTFEELNLGAPAHHYHWAEHEGGRHGAPIRISHLFTVARPTEALVKKHALVEVFVGGRPLFVSSREAFERLARALPWDNSRKLERIAPTGQEVGIDRFTDDRVGRAKLVDDLEQAFCDALTDHYRGAARARARGESLDPYFKGLSIGMSRNPAGLFMKGVKSAYEGFGFKQHAYKGLRFKDFKIEDLVEYVIACRKGYPGSLALDAPPGWKRRHKSEFTGPCPVAPFTLPNIKRGDSRMPGEYLELVKDTMRHWLTETSGGELGDTRKRLMPMKTPKGVIAPSEVFARQEAEPVIVHEYGFRGDGRSPAVLSISGGMNANAVRHYEGKRKDEAEQNRKALEERARKQYDSHPAPHFDPFLHQHNYDAISVFLSVSRDPQVSHSFLMGSRPANGYMYLVRAMGAVDQEATFKMVQYPGEQEISVPGGVDWEDIIASRPVVEGELADYCYFNENNRWGRDPKEREVQQTALRALMLFSIAPEIQKIIDGEKMHKVNN